MAEGGIVAGVVVAAVVVALNAGRSPSSSGAHAVARAGTHPTTLVTPPTTSRATTSSPSPATVQPAPATTLAPSTTVPPGGGPELSSIAPAQGAAGQLVVVSGINLMSPDGQVLTRFNGEPAPTRCQTQTSCTVTVPSMGAASATVTVTVTTAAGTSNAVSFSYN